MKDPGVYLFPCFLSTLLLASVSARGSETEIPVSGTTTVTEDEARAFSNAFSDAVQRGDTEAGIRLFDEKAMLDKTFAALKLSPEDEQAFKLGVQSAGAAFGNSTVGLLAPLVAKGEIRYDLLRIRTIDGAPRPLFRMLGLPPLGGVNYHEYILSKSKDGRVCADDVLHYALGERSSTNMLRFAAAMQGGKEITVAKEGKENDIARNGGALSSIMQLFAQQKYQEAVKESENLPQSLQEDRSLLAARLIFAMRTGRAEYADAFETFQRRFPDDAATDLYAMGYYQSVADYDKALVAMERLDKKVGGDPYLQVQRSILYFGKKDMDHAQAHAKKAVELEPGLVHGYWALLDVSLSLKQFQETARLLTVLDSQLNVEIPVLTRAKGYEEFVKSQEYQAWDKSKTVRVSLNEEGRLLLGGRSISIMEAQEEVPKLLADHKGARMVLMVNYKMDMESVLRFIEMAQTSGIKPVLVCLMPYEKPKDGFQKELQEINPALVQDGQIEPLPNEKILYIDAKCSLHLPNKAVIPYTDYMKLPPLLKGHEAEPMLLIIHPSAPLRPVFRFIVTMRKAGVKNIRLAVQRIPRW